MVGGVVDEAGGGASILEVVGDVAVLTLSPPGEGNEASWVGRILLGVFPLDCRTSVVVSTFDGDGVPFSSTLLSLFSKCPSFPVSLFGVSFGESSRFLSDREGRRLGGSCSLGSGVPSSPSENVMTEQ